MRKALPIWILALVYLVCSSRSCTDDGPAGGRDPESALKALQDSISNQFDLEHISDSNLRLFEESAIQKLSEWADFTRIASDTSMALVFRDKAREMTERLFISKEVALMAQRGESLPASWMPDSIMVSKRLIMTNDTLYTGSLNFSLNPAASPRVENRRFQKTITIYATRALKVFGKDTLRPWNIYLGWN